MEHEEVKNELESVAIEPKSIYDANASDMECYCLRCPHFLLIFNARPFFGNVIFLPDNWIEKGKQRSQFLKGTIQGVCSCKETEHAVGTEIVEVDLDWSEADWLETRTHFQFKANNVPPSLVDSVRKFVASEGCVLKAGRKRCMYFMEREMMAWNKKE